VTVISDSQAAIRQTEHLEPGPAQRLVRQINTRAWNRHAPGIPTEIQWIPGHSGIPGNEEADHQANSARQARGITVIERPYTLASHGARQIHNRRSAVKVKWMADRCSKHFSSRLKGKPGTKKSIPMTSIK
jgi:ribonuclease HI